MGAGKNKSHRKKRISKHVLEAAERKKQTDEEQRLLSAAENGGVAVATPSPSKAAPDDDTDAKKNEVKSSAKTKDPDEASSYLTLWNYDRVNKTKTWKFNKNTQSWLLRHMYDFDKVSKTTFALLVEYSCQGGEGARARMEEDAKRRARRYKDWEKKSSSQTKDDGDVATNSKDDAETKEKEKKPSEEDAAWNELDDHDKRKEYKRARKVLDSLKAVREKKSDDE